MKISFEDNFSPEKWDEFVKNNSSDFGLLQSSYWKEFQKSLGRKIFRLAAVDERGEILAAAQIIRQDLKFGKSYFYMPRGPIISKISNFKFQFSILDSLFAEIKKLARKEGAIFLRFDPAWTEEEVGKLGNDGVNIFEQLKSRSVGQVQPKQTLVLDLTKPEIEILAKMKAKTRYNIKVAQKHCVQIDEGENYFEDFWRLTKKTSQRDRFVAHNKEYYRKMLDILKERGTIKLLVAKYDSKVVAANLVIFFGEWCVYLHGASDYDWRDKMAPYLLQWETMVLAKGYGCKYYDFWGLDEAKWPGVTRFKQGFCPETKATEYVGAFDSVYKMGWYKIYKLAKKFSI